MAQKFKTNQLFLSGFDVNTLFYPLSSNPLSYITSSQTGQFYSSNNPNGYITGVNTGTFVTTGQTGIFINTGMTGQFYPRTTNPSGYAILKPTGAPSAPATTISLTISLFGNNGSVLGTPSGWLTTTINGTGVKIPYYI